MRRIADYRAADKHDPEYYARHTVEKAQGEIERETIGTNNTRQQITQDL